MSETENGNSIFIKKAVECYWPDYIKEIDAIFLYHQSGYYLNKNELQKLIERLNNALKHYDESDVDQFNEELKKKHEEELKQMRLENKKYEPKPIKKKHGFIYFITDATGLVKIGIAKDVKARFRSMKVGNPTLKILHYIKSKDMESQESLLHEYFEEKRINGEWFKLDEKDLEFIKSLEGDI